MSKLLPLLAALAACGTTPDPTPAPAFAPGGFERPSELVFGESLASARARMELLCESVTQRVIEPRQLPTATRSQVQLDCVGIPYAGESREAELVFADGVLDLVWILLREEELPEAVAAFTELHGPPTHADPEVTFFLDAGAAVRRTPAEVLFIADRLRGPYGEFMAGKETQ